MRCQRLLKWGMLVASGAVILQAPTCIPWSLLNTALLGVTAAGAFGILRNL